MPQLATAEKSLPQEHPLICKRNSTCISVFLAHRIGYRPVGYRIMLQLRAQTHKFSILWNFLGVSLTQLQNTFPCDSHSGKQTLAPSQNRHDYLCSWISCSHDADAPRPLLQTLASAKGIAFPHASSSSSPPSLKLCVPWGLPWL